MELEIKLSQNQTLTPQMELSVRILQMDSMRLVEYLKEVMLENPVAEIEEPPQKEDKRELALRKLEWLENQTHKEKENTGYYDEEDDLTLEKTVAAVEGESLVEHLMAQITFEETDAELAQAARFVIGCLDENGYLTAGLEEMAEESGLPTALLERALERVQSCDPAGVGARDLGECLCLQLPEEDALARRLACGCLEDVARNRIPQLAKRLGEPAEAVAAAVERIRRLNPKPGALYGRETPPSYITPDVVVTSFEDRYNVMLCEFSYPQIHISPSYLRMAKETSDKEVVDYIGNKVRQIEWIQKCIESRNKTLLEVSKAIVKRQERFFRYGPQYLNVLRMRDVAEMVGLHESTVSRAVRDKYLQCAHGVYPLRHFFVKGVEGDGGQGASSHSIKFQIKELIEGEDQSSPLSDQRITDLLAAKGICISRRTVAKYREELGIPKSSDRSLR